MDETAVLQFPAQADIQLDLRVLFLGAIRVTIEHLLEEEVKAMIGASRYERTKTRRDARNGTYLRQLMTSMGHVDVVVPRTRDQGSPIDVLGRYQRRTDDLDQAIVSAYVNGVSTRKMGDVTEALLGEKVGRSTVSRVTKSLEDEIEALRREKLEEPIYYLYLDATFLNARWARGVENVSALVAYGVGPNGHRKLLGVSIGAQESEDTWTELLSQLIDRGLHGVKLVVADDHRGLTKAARLLFPEAKIQRCLVHFERNVVGKAPQRLRKRLCGEFAAIFAADSREKARKKLDAFKAGLGAEVPESLECLEAGFSAASVFYDFPKAHWKRIRTTNGVERLHVEIKRRIRAVGAFPNRDSALRLITAVVVQATRVWSDRRYLDMSLLKEVNDQAA